MSAETPQSVFVGHLTTLAKTLCERPGKQYVPQCEWSDFFDDETIRQNESQGHVVDKCLAGFHALYSQMKNVNQKGGELPFKISTTTFTNSWPRAAIVALECATVVDWPKDSAARMTPEHIPRLHNEFKAIATVCPAKTPIAWHVACVLLVLELLQAPLQPASAYTTLVTIAGIGNAADLQTACEHAKTAAFSAKALEYFQSVELGEARFEIAAAIDPSKPSIYARQAAASSVFLGAAQISEADKKAIKELIVEIPRTTYKAIEDQRFQCDASRSERFNDKILVETLERALELRSKNV